MKIRRATSDDLDAIRALVERAYERYIERIGCRPGPMDADYPALVDAGRVDVAEADGEVAGVIVIESHPDHVFVDNVAVAIERQGHGIGRALLEHAEDVARANGVSELRLYTNAAMTENIAIYPRLGWVETGRGTQHGFKRVFFAKRV